MTGYSYRASDNQPAKFRTLISDLVTPIGVYPAGTRVVALREGRRLSRICLDQVGHHPAGRCHTATVASAVLARDPYVPSVGTVGKGMDRAVAVSPEEPTTARRTRGRVAR